MRITIFSNVIPFPSQKDKHYVAKLATFGEVIEVNSFRELNNYITKYAWSPAIFDGKRKSNNFKEIQLLTYDIDEGLSLDEAEIVLDYLRCSYIIAKTVNHQKEKNGIICDRYRIILPLEIPIINTNDYAHNWNRFAKYFKVDESCKDISRFYFGCYDSVIKENNSIRVISSKFIRKETIQTKPIDINKKGKLSNRTLKFLDSNGEIPNWHIEFLFSARDLRAQGYTLNEAESILGMITGYLDDKHDLVQLNYVYKDDSVKFEYREEK